MLEGFAYNNLASRDGSTCALYSEDEGSTTVYPLAIATLIASMFVTFLAINALQCPYLQ